MLSIMAAGDVSQTTPVQITHVFMLCSIQIVTGFTYLAQVMKSNLLLIIKLTPLHYLELPST